MFMLPPKPAQSLGDALGRCKGALVTLGMFSLFVNILMLTGPLYMLQVYDRVLASGSMPTLLGLTILVSVLYAGLAGLDWIRQMLFSRVGSRVEDELADPVLDQMLSGRLADPGADDEKTIQDLRTVRRFFASPAMGALFDIPFAPLFFLVLFLLHWAFGLWAVFGGIVLITLAIANQVVNQKAISETEQLEQRSRQQLRELASNIDAAHALGMRGVLARHWRHVLDESDEAMTRSGSRLSFFSASTKSVRLFLQSAILGLGAWMAVEGASTAGAMIAASILMGRAIAPVEQLVGQWRQISNVLEAARSLNETVKDNLEAAAEKMELPPLTGRVAMEKVSLVLPGDDEPILRNIDFALEPGDVLGIIGPSGSGKSSIARLLVGVWSATSGDVRFDGADISTYDQARLGPQIGYLPQEVKLFSGTAKDNIARFDAQPAPEGIISAAIAAGCHDLILGFDGGYETQLGAGGVYLSAGQRQRLGLARALYGAPNFVVLDEPNSNLDVDGDSALASAIDGLRKRKAVTVIIAHRAGILQKCTKLLAIAKGKTAMFGPRDEVLSKLVPASAPSKSAPKQAGRVTALRKAPSRA